MTRQGFSFIPMVLALLLAMFVFSGGTSHAQTAMVQVPFMSEVLGMPASTYNGTTAGTPCSNGLGTATTGNSIAGDGCPGTQTTLNYPYGAAVDSYGNVVTASASGTVGITVLYEGGTTMYNLLVAAKPNYSFTPLPGHAYFLTTGTVGYVNSPYYCNGANANNGTAHDKYLSGCPSTFLELQSRAVTMDPDGNIFIAGYEPYQIVHVIYAGGTRAANLIKAYNSWVTGTPQVGAIYPLSNLPTGSSDFGSMRGIAVQVVNSTTENLFVSDNATSASVSGVDAATTGNQIKEFVCPAGTVGCNTAYAAINGNTNASPGWVTYIPGTTTAGSTSQYGDGGPPSAALVDGPACLITDKFGNLFIGDYNDARIRVVYNGGTIPPVFKEGVNSNAYVTPAVGNIYTAVGGGTLAQSPVQANLLSTNGKYFGVDPEGNLYFASSTSSGNVFWVENAATGLAVNTMWAATKISSGYTFTSSSAPGANVACNGVSGGPVMTDAYGDGCPGTETNVETPDYTPIVFDPAGNFYLVDARQSSAATGVVYKYSYGNQFGSVPVGSSLTLPFAFTPSINQGGTTYTPVLSFSSPEYTDAGNDNCAKVTANDYYATQTCVYNITFTPKRAGLRPGSLTLTQAGTGVLDTINLGGVGTGAQISIDPATSIIVGIGLSPAGVAVDTSGNIYIADTTSNSVYKSTSGAAPVSFATGLSSPGQVAVSGTGAVYVADAGNNRIASVSSSGGAVSSFLSGTFTLSGLSGGSLPYTTDSTSLSAPAGVAVDSSGDVYISDTDNNRVIEVVTPQGGGGSSNVVLGFSGLNAPRGLAVDSLGDVFVVDSGNGRVVELNSAGVQSVISVTPSLATPVGVSVDPAGDLYIADSGNANVVVVPNGSTAASSLLGNTTGLSGLAVDNLGDLAVAATSATGILAINRNSVSYGYGSGGIGSSQSQSFTLTNTGNASLTTGASLDTATETTDFILATGSTGGCTTSDTLTAGAQCTLLASFDPQSSGSFTNTVTFPTYNAGNSAQLVLTGTGASAKVATTTGIGTLSPVSPVYGQGVTVPVTVTGSSTNLPSGNVTLSVDGSTYATQSLTAGSTSSSTSFTVSGMTAGTHSLTASYVGDAYNNSSSTTSAASVSVTKATPTLSWLPSATSQSGGAAIGAGVLDASVSSPSGLAGAMSYTATPSGGSAGAITASTVLAVGSYTLTASFVPSDATDYNSGTASISYTVNVQAPTVSLVCTPTAVVPGQAVSCTATVSGSGVTPTGSVTFAATSTGGSQGTLGTATLTNGAATYNGLIWVGNDVVTATYNGDTNYSSSSSNTIAVSNYTNSGKLSFNWPYINWGQAVAYGASSGAWPVTVQNLTGAAVNMPTISSSSANFVVTAGSCNGTGTLAVGASCSFSVVFTPTTGGSATGTKVTGTLTASTTSSSNDTNTLAESGIAVSSSLSFNWPFLNFTPTVAVGASSAAWPVVLTNSSGTATTLASPAVSFSDASFQLSSDNCSGQVLAGGASCSFSVVFTPLAAEVTASGVNVLSATMTASGNSGSVTGALSVSGWAGSALSFNWPFVNFQGVSMGSTGANAWPVTVTNNSGQSLTGLSYSFAGVTNYASGAFTINDANNCFGQTLAAGAGCTFNIVPTPQSTQSVGSYSATLTVSGTAGSTTLSSYALTVSGQANAGGLAINWNQDQQAGVSTIDFGPQNAVGAQSGPWPITVYNNTASVQTLTLAPSLGVFTTDVTTLTNVPAGGSAVFNLYFTPTAAQQYQGTLTITGTGCSYSFNTWGQGK